MPTYTVQKGKRYKATIALGFVQSWFSNATVAGKFQEVGFTEVEVSGSGRSRLGKGPPKFLRRLPRSRRSRFESGASPLRRAPP